ncbi:MULTISPECIES: hypothetical protein [unclassified Maridesulfovibrio]|uniref:hypothetical protein n=1 Tax=unclassified Maridesulfovibrio TaxID=2794999 RepID=UPI003B3E8FD2
MVKFNTRKDLIDFIIEQKSKRFNSSFLIRTIPGADDGRSVLKKIIIGLKHRAFPNKLYSLISADSIEDELDLVEEAIRGWCLEDRALTMIWEREKKDGVPDKAVQLLQEFCSVASEEGFSLCLFIDKFHKIFTYMSKSLLGMMRNLDSDEVLTFINASDAGYAGLYRIRSTSEPSFTSDYGLAHSQHDLLPLSEEEACRLWEEYHKQSQCGSHETKVFFQIAYEESGGYPSPFKKSYNLYIGRQGLTPDRYAGILRSELSCLFVKMIKQAERYEGKVFIELLAAIAVKEFHQKHARQLISFDMAHLYTVHDGPEPSLLCNGLGVAAMLEVDSRRLDYGSVEKLYRSEYFDLCYEITANEPALDVLRLGSKLMKEVYGVSSHGRLFKPSVDWCLVAKIAEEASAKCENPEKAVDFINWLVLANSFKKYSINSPKDTSDFFCSLKDKSQAEIIDAVYLLGARYCAAKSVDHPTQAAYLALPLLEGIVVCSLALYVEQLGGEANALNCISEQMIQCWKLPSWKDKKVTKSIDKLGASKLCFILAMLSDFVHDPVFNDVQDLHKTIEFFGDTRNPLAHNVIEVEMDTAIAIMDTVEHLWERSIEKKLAISTSQIVVMFNPPSSFL